jgi:hypothetical protein
MKQNTEIFLYLGPCAVVGGGALAIATQGGGYHTLAWCVFTAAGVICLGLISASYQISHARPAGQTIFHKLPTDLDVLLSNSDDRQRSLAASRIADLGCLLGRDYPYRTMALRMLELLAQKESSDELRASMIGAWTALGPEECPEWIVTIAANPETPPYLARAASSFVARTVCRHPDIWKDPMRKPIINIDAFWSMTYQLNQALEAANNPAEKAAIGAFAKGMKSNLPDQNWRNSEVARRLLPAA